jgi:hypothetical protein
MIRRVIQHTLGCAGIVLTAVTGACSTPPAPQDSPATAEGQSTGHRNASNNGSTLVVGRAPITTTGTPAIVILEPRHSAPLPEPAAMPYMDQVSRNFIPSILFVRTGYPADFRNSDEELHNINVKDGGTHEQIFNVALPPDVGYRHTFARSGVYDVSCDIHGAMTAQIIAAASPYVTPADADGHFEIPNVVRGPYLVTVYAGAKPIEKMVEVTGERTELNLTQ